MLVGRKKELLILKEAAVSEYSSFVAVYGRRRIGKTFLINEAFDYRFFFKHAGLANGSKTQEIEYFASSLSNYGYEFEKQPKNWIQAFAGLEKMILHSGEGKKVIFLDELSWMDTPKSDFLSSLEGFWNDFASSRKDIVLIVSASATHWMISKVIHNKGGLYNRLTDRIHLQPFDLSECSELVSAQHLTLSRMQILEFYMIFGGVPYYWTLLKKGLSLSQNVDRLLFGAEAILKDEYSYLYASVFRSPEQYVSIIEALGRKRMGLTREELLLETGIGNTGDFSKKLGELENCGYIRKYFNFGSKKESVYRLVDHFTLFHFFFLKEAAKVEGFWSKQMNSPLVHTWRGLSFEMVCLDHVDQIKRRLGVSGIIVDAQSWRCRKDFEKGLFGSQIDLLLVRKDQVINVCEMKYSSQGYMFVASDELSMNRKVNDLIAATGTKYSIQPVLVTTLEPVQTSAMNMIQAIVTLDDLFEAKWR